MALIQKQYGRPDWVRVGAMAGALLFVDIPTAFTTGVTLGPFTAWPWPTIAAEWVAGAQDVRFDLTFYTDPTLADVISGSRADCRANDQLFATYASSGPVFTIDITQQNPLLANTYDFILIFSESDRRNIRLFNPAFPILDFAGVIAAGATQTIFASPNFGGPAKFYMQKLGPTTDWDLGGLDIAGNFHRIMANQGDGAGLIFEEIALLPQITRLQIKNNDAAGHNYRATIYPV